MSIKIRRPRMVATLIPSLFLMSSIYAGVNGPYIGLQLGMGKVHDTGIESNEMFALVTNALNTDAINLNAFQSGTSGTGFAGRIFLGYQFTCNWGMELGWSQLPNIPVTATAAGLNGVAGRSFTAYTSGTLKTDSFDAVLKAILPLRNYFSVYAKGGVAYLESRANESVNVTQYFKVYNASDTTVLYRYYPTFGAGVTYDITPFTVADLTWTRVQKYKNSNVGSTDMITLGISYNFGYVG